jgi:DNA-binding MarR family transcriptional regulator
MDQPGPVDRLVAEWQSVRPDLDFGPMALFARSNRFVTLALRQLDAALGEFGLTVGEFDVLSALRRSGEPFTLKPSELADRLMVTRAGITARVDRLEEHGVVARRRDPLDRRSEPIVLTDVGRRLIDSALLAYLAAETELFGGLSSGEHAELDALLRRLVARATPPSLRT